MGLNSFILIYLHEQRNEEIVCKAEKVFRLIFAHIISDITTTIIAVCLALRQFQILKQSIGKENAEET